MFKYLYPVLFLTAFSTCLNAQVANVAANMLKIHGIVFSSNDLRPVEGAQIFIGRRFETVSNNEGKFIISVRHNDTIYFSCLGFADEIYVIPDTIDGEEFIAGIYLSTDTLSAGEVVIVSRLSGLRSAILRSNPESDSRIINAKNNLAISAHQGRITTGRLGDPSTNYEFLRQRQRQDAYEKGQIPSDKIAGISPLMLIPAMYLLINGLPEKPQAVQPRLSDQEIDLIHKRYMENMRNKK